MLNAFLLFIALSTGSVLAPPSKRSRPAALELPKTTASPAIESPSTYMDQLRQGTAKKRGYLDEDALEAELAAVTTIERDQPAATGADADVGGDDDDDMDEVRLCLAGTSAWYTE